MRIAYFDCFSGVSGDMILGALIDAGLGLTELEAELARLKISGYRLKAEKTSRNGITGTKFTVEISEQHIERRFQDIIAVIEGSDLDGTVKASAREIFQELAMVEAGIHGKDMGAVHFHEVGGVDSIIDVVGAMVGMQKLGIEAIYSSRIHVGTGFVECRHGTLPVPAPASLAMLKGIPVYCQGIESELATPTGVAILKKVSRGFGVMPPMTIERIGYGAGSKELPIPNLLRVSVGEAGEEKYEPDEVTLIETNLDDVSPEIVAHAAETLLKRGALDVFMTPIIMKKNRPGTMLSVLTTPDRIDELLSIIFTEVATLGVRMHRLARKKLSREIISVNTKYGDIQVKIGRAGDQIMSIAPEYESCAQIAEKRGIPLKEVYDEAGRVARLNRIRELES